MFILRKIVPDNFSSYIFIVGRPGTSIHDFPSENNRNKNKIQTSTPSTTTNTSMFLLIKPPKAIAIIEKFLTFILAKSYAQPAK